MEGRGPLLFIGDSVTAAERSVSDASDLGRGFVTMIARALECRHPSVRVINKGVGGDRAADVEARWERDCLALDPDVITLLVGVNDTWRRFDRGQQHPLHEYAASLRRMLVAARARSTASIVLVEPFLLKVGFITEEWEEDLSSRREVVAQIAAETGCVFVPTQAAFDDEAGAAPATLLYDGVHPTSAGHRLLAQRWLTIAGGAS